MKMKFLFLGLLLLGLSCGRSPGPNSSEFGEGIVFDIDVDTFEVFREGCPQFDENPPEDQPPSEGDFIKITYSEDESAQVESCSLSDGEEFCQSISPDPLDGSSNELIYTDSFESESFVGKVEGDDCRVVFSNETKVIDQGESGEFQATQIISLEGDECEASIAAISEMAINGQSWDGCKTTFSADLVYRAPSE